MQMNLAPTWPPHLRHQNPCPFCCKYVLRLRDPKWTPPTSRLFLHSPHCWNLTVFSVRLLGFCLFFEEFAAFFCCLKQWCELMNRTKLDIKMMRLKRSCEKKYTKNEAWNEKGFKYSGKTMIKLSYCHTRDALVCYFTFCFSTKNLDEIIYKMRPTSHDLLWT